MWRGLSEDSPNLGILIQLAEGFGQDQDDGIIIESKLAYTEFTMLTRTTRPAAGIALGEMEDEDLVTRDRGHFLILQAGGLRDRAKEQT